MEDNKKIKIQIKSVFGDVLFEYEKENNTIKDTVEEAVRQDANLGGAYLRGANLGGANLGGANLGGANLGGANLRDAYLRGANLRDANLGDAYLRDAYLRGANLRDAYLGGANLGGAYLGDANLRDAYLGDANLRDAYLGGAKNIPYISLACPSDGAFVGWKKVYGFLVKLEIPKDAKRCSATTNKCRCDKAKVLEVINIRTNEQVSEIINESYCHLTHYKVGEMVYPDKFDDNRWNECSNGIHFFINKQDAINY